MRRRAREDSGASLIELIVAMGIMSVVMVIVTGSIIQIYRMVNRSEAISVAQSAVGLTFTRLDKEIRYAAGISTPGTSGSGDRYVEYVVANTGTATCVELRVQASTAQLQRRTWLQQGGTPGSWTVLAFGISGTTPFTTSPPTGNFAFQRLRINVIATSGSGATKASRQTDVTFTALNTSRETSSEDVCTDGRQAP